MTDWLNKRTYCGSCGLKVEPGVFHDCIKKRGPFTPLNTGTFWCAWCQSYATPIAGYNTTTCSNCGHVLHGVIANPDDSVMHYVNNSNTQFYYGMNRPWY